MYGVDWEGPMPVDAAVQVDVPATQSPLTAIDYEMLRAEIDPLRNTTQYGIDIYEEVLSFVISKV